MSLKVYLEKIQPWTRKHNKWTIVTLSDVDDKTLEHLWNMYYKTYATQGLDNLTREQLTNKENLRKEGYKLFWFIDLDRDPDPDAFIVYKHLNNNNKISLLGSDGRAESQKVLVNQVLKLLRGKSWFIEGGLKIDKICRQNNISYLTDEEKIKKLIKKEITMATAEDIIKDGHGYPTDQKGYYKRKLSSFDGEDELTIIKRIYGNPNV